MQGVLSTRVQRQANMQAGWLGERYAKRSCVDLRVGFWEGFMGVKMILVLP